DIFKHSELEECIHLPQVSAAQELQTKAQIRLASLIEEKLVTRISVLSTLLGGGKTTERLLVRISIETHKTAPDFDQTAADKAKIGLSGHWAKLVATCSSKRTDNATSYGLCLAIAASLTKISCLVEQCGRQTGICEACLYPMPVRHW